MVNKSAGKNHKIHTNKKLLPLFAEIAQGRQTAKKGLCFLFSSAGNMRPHFMMSNLLMSL